MYDGLQESIEGLGWTSEAAAVLLLLAEWGAMSSQEVYRLAKLIDSFDKESAQPRIHRKEEQHHV